MDISCSSILFSPAGHWMWGTEHRCKWEVCCVDSVMLTLTSQVICSARVDGEGGGGAHGGRLLSVYCQHGEVLLGDQTDWVPLAVVEARACVMGAEKQSPSENTQRCFSQEGMKDILFKASLKKSSFLVSCKYWCFVFEHGFWNVE